MGLAQIDPRVNNHFKKNLRGFLENKKKRNGKKIDENIH